MDAMRFDEHLWLSGDEDCGVGINCRICDRGGAPVAYYEGISGHTFGVGVEQVTTITALIAAGERHLAQHG